MSTPFRRYDPHQGLLFPPSLRDWLPEDHLAWFISDTVDELDIKVLMESYRRQGSGNLAYHPRMLLKVLIYGYCTGVYSSRKMAKQVEENVAFRALAGNQQPNHRTICRFREVHLKHFERLFVQVVQIAKTAGLVQLGLLAGDGSKVKANASKHKAMSYARMQEEERRLQKENRALTKAAKAQDVIEDKQYGPDFRGDEIPEELRRRETCLKKIQEAKARLEARKKEEEEERQKAKGRDPDDQGGPSRPGRGRKAKYLLGQRRPKDQVNFTDPDSWIMKSHGGFEQSYKIRIAVSEEYQIIVVTGLSNCAADNHQLIPMVKAAEANTGEKPARIVADSGYRSEENFKALHETDIQVYVSVGREGNPGQRIQPKLAETQKMQRRLKGKRGRQVYKKRKQIVEPVFGWIKTVTGFRSFSVRGLAKVSGEWSLVCLAMNLRRMNGLIAWQ